MLSKSKFSCLFILPFLVVACGQDDSDDGSERSTPVTITEAVVQPVEWIERSIGRLRANSAPNVAAETAGAVAVIHHDAGDAVEAGERLAELDDQVQTIAVNSARAELRRLEALMANERRRVRRLTNLREQQSVSQDQLDEAETNVESLEAQIQAAQSALEDVEYNLARTRIVSPVSGIIQERLVSAGDFVNRGQVMFELVSPAALRALVPLPEHLQNHVEVGQPVRLWVPSRPDDVHDFEVTEIRPQVGSGSRAIELIVDLDNPGGWRVGGSVSAEIVIERRDGLVVPPTSVVRRPDGRVVYVIEDSRARERPVEVGLRDADWIEILEGVSEGERVVVDGAGFMTDDARVTVEEGGDAR
ncbi:efflux RND transporter periplasmic adaptor subunit [Wenzhouxiangella sp. 15181]|nr:efflux RND transporter periplasmic adaptor subunit [Wenzhouxiangella sp. 15181]RFP67444.1 efflux RND transporter periplasmic adaptor subunit [Wenzhouxiangella sp. 15190]